MEIKALDHKYATDAHIRFVDDRALASVYRADTDYQHAAFTGDLAGMASAEEAQREARKQIKSVLGKVAP